MAAPSSPTPTRWYQLLAIAVFLPIAGYFFLLRMDVITSDPPPWVWVTVCLAYGVMFLVVAPIVYLRNGRKQDEALKRGEPVP